MTSPLVRGPKVPHSAMESTDPLPLTPEEITPEWLSKALDVDIESVTIVSVVHGASTKVFLDLTFAEQQPDGAAAPRGASTSRKSDDTLPPRRVCVKGGFNPVVCQAFPEMHATYRREAEFYHHIAPQTDMLLPRTWFCGTAPTPGHGPTTGVFIMSDVSGAARFGDPLEPWHPDRVRAGLRQLASLHGRTWRREQRRSSSSSNDGGHDVDQHHPATLYPWLFDPQTKAPRPVPTRQMIRALFAPEPWALRFADHCRPPVAPPLADRARMLAAYEALWAHADAETRFHCIVHGDNHVGNTLIATDQDGEQGTPGFIDWQCLLYGSALQDVVYFLTGALTVDDRRRCEADLVDAYLAALRDEGGPALTRADVWEDYRKHSLHGFLWACTPLRMQPEEVVFAMTERYSASIMDHGALELLGV